MPWPSGIFERSQAPFSATLYQITNQWQGQIGSEFVRVYAGAKTADPTQGIIVVLTTSTVDLADHTRQTGGLFLTPDKLGALRIVSANGPQLTLVTPGGRQFMFDAAARTLVPR